MSWLFVALIPGLLMLATLGLQRVETSLGRETVSVDDVAEFLERAKSTAVAARRDTDGGSLRFAPCRTTPVAEFDEFLEDVTESFEGFETSTNDQVRVLRMPRYVVPGPKTGFQQTRHADPV